jgi:replicative DNA helicase
MSTETKQTAWKNQREAFEESLVYMNGRMKGEIRSLRTPWPKWNDASTDGIEWHSTTVIGGRPATGKTLIKDQIVREAFKLNAGDDFRVLEFQFEMRAVNSAIREYSSVIGKSYKHLCSAGTKLSLEELKQCHEYAKERVKYPIDVVEEPCTVAQFIRIIHDYMDAHAMPPLGEGKRLFRKTIITLDHSLLLKTGPGENGKFDTLYALGEALTSLKRIYPIAFIILSQLGRGVDSPERNEDGKYGNYILPSDIFGADALLQHADMLVGINRPGDRKIRFYGPDRYIIEDDRVLVVHFLKCRNGDTRMSFFKAEFDKMKISEIPTPATQEKRIKT